MENKIPFPHDNAVRNKLFRRGPRKPRFLGTRVVVALRRVGAIFLVGFVLIVLGPILNWMGVAVALNDVVSNVLGDVGVALATGAVLFILERNFFLQNKVEDWQRLDIESLLKDICEVLQEGPGGMPSQLQLAYFGTVRKGLFTWRQEVYRFTPDGNNGWPQSIELGQGPIGSAVLDQRSLAIDVDGWRWCVVPFAARARAGCLIAIIPLTEVKDAADVQNSVTETYWLTLSDFSNSAASILEPSAVSH